MLGHVSADGREPVLPLTLLGFASAGFAPRRITAEAVVDTGFDGELTLPPGLIRDLSYPYAGFTRATLADGSTVRFDYHEGRVLWHSRERDILVLAADGAPLVGMALLHGSEVRLRVVDGGSVVIEPLF
jgi:clan AA aspartic protease